MAGRYGRVDTPPRSNRCGHVELQGGGAAIVECRTGLDNALRRQPIRTTDEQECRF
jgi:hypothetical protein